MIIVHGSVVIRPDRVEDALALSHQHVARSRQEPGCLSHAVYLAAEDPQRLMFVEEWDSLDALRTHFEVPASSVFVRSLSALAEGSPVLKIFSAQELDLSA